MSALWSDPVSRGCDQSDNYLVLIGRIHDELGRFTARSVQTKWGQIRWVQWYERSFRSTRCGQKKKNNSFYTYSNFPTAAKCSQFHLSASEVLSYGGRWWRHTVTSRESGFVHVGQVRRGVGGHRLELTGHPVPRHLTALRPLPLHASILKPNLYLQSQSHAHLYSAASSSHRRRLV